MKLTESQDKTIKLLNPWWGGYSIELGIHRTDYLSKINDYLKEKQEILFLLGSRRVGKTRIIFQTIYKLIADGIPTDKILFLSLDNTNLEKFNWYDYIAESNFDYIFLDEIQYSSKWAQNLKSLFDLPNKKMKIICSGSSSKLIEDDKAFLTGRNTNLIVTTLDFNEFLKFTDNKSTVKDYLFYGGYPEYVLEKEPNYLNDLVRDIIEKDIAKVHKVRNTQYLFDICQMLAKQVGFKSSSNKIASVLKLDNKTVENYIQYLREAKLIEVVYQYSDSLNKRLYSPKKYYFNDLGMRNSFSGFSDKGSLVENAVFLKLSKKYGAENIFFMTDTASKEVDFVVKLDSDRLMYVESKYNNSQTAIKNSVAKLFYEDVHDKKITKRIVVTNEINDSYEEQGKEVNLVSLSKFLIIETQK